MPIKHDHSDWTLSRRMLSWLKIFGGRGGGDRGPRDRFEGRGQGDG